MLNILTADRVQEINVGVKLAWNYISCYGNMASFVHVRVIVRVRVRGEVRVRVRVRVRFKLFVVSTTMDTMSCFNLIENS